MTGVVIGAAGVCLERGLQGHRKPYLGQRTAANSGVVMAGGRA